jgi:GDP-L-fucose synthase
MEFEGKVYFNVNKPDGQYRKPSDNSKLKNYLPDFNFTPLYDGLKKTIKYFIKNYENVRK